MFPRLPHGLFPPFSSPLCLPGSFLGKASPDDCALGFQSCRRGAPKLVEGGLPSSAGPLPLPPIFTLDQSRIC